MSKLAKLAYERAPAGSPDKFILTEPALFTWRDPPARVWSMVKAPVQTPDGAIQRTLGEDGAREIRLYICEGFFFSVSVAPNLEGAVEGSAPHDLIYKHVILLARAWGCSVKDVLAFADHWFLAVMRHEKFGFSRAYFLGVSVFGYAFNRLCALFSRPQSS